MSMRMSKQLLSGGELPRQFVVLAAMAQAEVDDLAAAGIACGFNRLANLAVGIMALAVDESGCQFDLKRIAVARVTVEQVDQGRAGDGGASHERVAACWSSRQDNIS